MDVNATVTTLPNSTTGLAKPAPGSSYDVKTILLAVALCLIIFVGTIGNGFVCYFFGVKRRNKWTIPDRLFLYLGIVDLLSSLVNPAFFLYVELTRYSKWHFGRVACKVIAPFGPITTLLSAFLIQIITVDRYLVIVKPFGRRYGARHINIAVLAAIVWSIASYLHYIISVDLYGTNPVCKVLDVTDKRYSIPSVTMVLMQDVTFIIVIFFTNKAIYSKFKKRQRNFSSESGAEVTHIQRQRLFRMLLVMSSVFLLLILPRDLLQLSYTISWMDGDGIPYTIHLNQANTIVKILHISNSCVNVFIYSKMHTHFNEALKKIACRSSHPNYSFTSESTSAPTLNTTKYSSRECRESTI